MNEQKNGLGVWVIKIYLTDKTGELIKINALKQQHPYRAPEVEMESFTDLLYWALKKEVDMFKVNFETKKLDNLILLGQPEFYTLQEPLSGSMFYDLLKQGAENQGMFLSEVIKLSAHFYLLKGKELA